MSQDSGMSEFTATLVIARQAAVDHLPRMSIQTSMGVVILASDGSLVVGRVVPPGASSHTVRLNRAELERLREAIDGIIAVSDA